MVARKRAEAGQISHLMSPHSPHREDGKLEAAMCPEVGYPSLASMAGRGIYIMKRLCYVTADSDHSGEWMEIEAMRGLRMKPSHSGIM